MLTQKFHHNPYLIWGYSTSQHLLLDLDNTTVSKVEKLVTIIQHEYKDVGSALIVESSPPKTADIHLQHCTGLHRSIQRRQLGNYHVIFSNRLSWNRIMKIVRTLAELQILNKDYVKIRGFRGDLTLRVSKKVTPDGVKEVPKPICTLFKYAENDGNYIDDYLRLLYFFEFRFDS